MRILVACEESQAVTIELRSRGHEAFSCDLLPCSGGHPEWHLQTDVSQLLKEYWDMIIAFPPCTFLSNAGAVRLRINGEIQNERMEKALKAKEFFLQFYNANCNKIAIENPVPGSIHSLPPYSQIIQPYMFGEPWLKKTCLWLKGLPPLFATELCIPSGKWIETSSHGRAAILGEWNNKGQRTAIMRSKTFPGIAKAMAEQWT